MKRSGKKAEKWPKLRQQLNALARDIYASRGNKVREEFDFQNSGHPEERACFADAVLGYQHFGRPSRVFWREEVESWKGQP